MRWKTGVSLALAGVGIFFGIARPMSAQQETKGAVSQAEQFLDSTSIKNYKDIVPPELSTFVKRSELVFQVGNALPNAEGYRTKKREPEASYSVMTEGIIASPQNISFSTAPFTLEGASAASMQEQGYKILWNASAMLWQYPHVRYDSSAYIFGSDRGTPKKLQLQLERIHPALYEKVPGGLSPIFRERIKVLKPDPLRTLGWLTLRFFGAEEDYVWVSSPAIKKIRQVTGSNRSDPIFDEMLALDHFLVWSGKVERVKPLSVRSVSMLVPFHEVSMQKESSKDDCSEYGFGASGGVMLNSRSHRYQGRGGWIPSNIKMYKRELWKVELSSLDPYSLDSQQTLYVDKQSMMPVYWSSYSVKGAFRRFGIGIIGSMHIEKEGEPMLVGQVLFSEKAWRVASVANSIAICQRKEIKEVVGAFDPSTFISFKSLSS